MPTREELITEANRDATTSPKRVTVLYADYGKRKTTTAATMVGESGLLLSSDDSWKVLLNDRHKDLMYKLHVINLEGLSQLEYVDFSGYDTIIWDTLSQSVDVYLDLLYSEANWGGKYRDKIVSNNKELKGLEILAPMDYRVTRDGFRPVLNKLFRETDAHIIFNCQVKEPIPGLSTATKFRPDVPAATFKIVGTRADLIGYIRAGSKGKFTIDLGEDSALFMGKSRIQQLQGQMDLDDFTTKYKEIVF